MSTATTAKQFKGGRLNASNIASFMRSAKGEYISDRKANALIETADTNPKLSPGTRDALDQINQSRLLSTGHRGKLLKWEKKYLLDNASKAKDIDYLLSTGLIAPIDLRLSKKAARKYANGKSMDYAKDLLKQYLYKEFWAAVIAFLAANWLWILLGAIVLVAIIAFISITINLQDSARANPKTFLTESSTAAEVCRTGKLEGIAEEYGIEDANELRLGTGFNPVTDFGSYSSCTVLNSFVLNGARSTARE